MIAALLLAASAWSKTDIGMEGAYIGLHVADWIETREVVSDPRYYEGVNPILGKHPSQQSVDLYFAGALASQLFIANLLPSNWRKVWIGSGITVEYMMIRKNAKIGIRVNF